MVEQIEAELGPVALLVNNASIIQVGPLEAMTLDGYAERWVAPKLAAAVEAGT